MGRPPKQSTYAPIKQVDGVAIMPETEKQKKSASQYWQDNKPTLTYEQAKYLRDNKEYVKIYKIETYPDAVKRYLFLQFAKIKGKWKSKVGNTTIEEAQKLTGLKIT